MASVAPHSVEISAFLEEPQLESLLESTVTTLAQGGPPTLTRALHHAVFPAGARLRPRLCLAIAEACGACATDLVDARHAAVAIELFHCASLVHDDLPCFDDAATRRGQSTVHRAFGEAIAVLTGDALIVGGFSELGRCRRAGALVRIAARALGASRGLVAGQAWESEKHVDLGLYHRAKTAALFEAACEFGAAVAEVPVEPFTNIGTAIGEAYQLLDDVADMAPSEIVFGKSNGRDASLGRPNAVRSFGVAGTIERAEGLMKSAIGEIPPSARRDSLALTLNRISESVIAKARSVALGAR